MSSICPPPAHEAHQGEGLAALAKVAGSGEGSIQGQSAVAWINEYTGRNRAAWLSISDFLSRQNLCQVLKARAAGALAHAGVSAGAGATAAVFQTLPDGNHGENLSTGRSV